MDMGWQPPHDRSVLGWRFTPPLRSSCRMGFMTRLALLSSVALCTCRTRASVNGRYDLGGKTLLPALIDTQGHMIPFGKNPRVAPEVDIPLDRLGSHLDFSGGYRTVRIPGRPHRLMDLQHSLHGRTAGAWPDDLV
jgi:hypothetical protein